MVKRIPASFGSSGYTLIELLLYVSIVSALLSTVVLFFNVSVESRVKNQSISEVEQQGQLAMEQITRAIRNADSITAPTAGNSASSLTLAVPTGALSPTIFDLSGNAVLGYNLDGTARDDDDTNFINASKWTAPASGTITALYARIGTPVSAAPNNIAQMAIYNGNATAPTTVLASSGSTTIAANSWVAFSIPPTAVVNGQTYWLAYNTNGANINTDNNTRYRTGAVGQSRYMTQTYGTWPAWGTSTAQAREYSMYAPIDTGSGSGVLQIKEGAAAVVALTNSKVRVTNLTFTNLTRPSTPGAVQITLTLARINNLSRNEFDYQKTFTTTASLRWP